MDTAQFPEIAKAVGAHKYLKRVPLAGGGYRYVYKEKEAKSRIGELENRRQLLIVRVENGEKKLSQMRREISKLGSDEVKVYDKMLATKDPKAKKKLDQQSDVMAAKIGEMENKADKLEKYVHAWATREVKLMDQVMALKKIERRATGPRAGG